MYPPGVYFHPCASSKVLMQVPHQQQLMQTRAQTPHATPMSWRVLLSRKHVSMRPLIPQEPLIPQCHPALPCLMCASRWLWKQCAWATLSSCLVLQRASPNVLPCINFVPCSLLQLGGP